jgi:hypothetical protein
MLTPAETDSGWRRVPAVKLTMTPLGGTFEKLAAMLAHVVSWATACWILGLVAVVGVYPPALRVAAAHHFGGHPAERACGDQCPGAKSPGTGKRREAGTGGGDRDGGQPQRRT